MGFFSKNHLFTLDEEKKLCYHEFQIIQMQDRGAALISIQGIRPGACSAMEKGCAAEGMLVSGAQRHLGVGLTALRLSPESNSGVELSASCYIFCRRRASTLTL